MEGLDDEWTKVMNSNSDRVLQVAGKAGDLVAPQFGAEKARKPWGSPASDIQGGPSSFFSFRLVGDNSQMVFRVWKDNGLAR